MPDKIRGITIEIGGDTSGLTKSLKGVNASVKDTQKQLKDVNKLLKLDPTNTELLKQKQQLLGKEVKETKDKIAELKKVQETMDKNGVDKNSDQYMALRREIISTEQELKNLETAARQSNATLQQISATAQKVSEATGNLAQKTRGLSTAAGAGLVAIGGMAYSAVTAADDLNTLSKQTGLSTATLQKMQYAADLIDVPVENITSAVSKMTKTLGSSEKKFTDLGITTRDANGELRSTEDIFNSTLLRLSAIENETERDTVAMDLFGKSANELAGVIDDGGEALRQYGDKAEELGLIMDQDTLDSLNDVNDEIDTLKANLKGTLAKSGAKAVEAFAPALEKVADAIAKVLEFIGSLDADTIQMIITILAVVAAISPLLSLISGISGAISVLLPLLSGPVGIIMAIVAAVVLIGTVVYENWDTIKGVLETAWQKVKDVFNGIKDTILGVLQNIANAAKAPINQVISFFNSAINSINNLIIGLNSIGFDMPGWLGGGSFHLNIPTINNIPYLAKGGILSSGSAIVGEAGPELLTMNGNRARVQPLTNSGAAAASGAQQMVTKVDVNFTGSLAQLATILNPYITAETSRVGTSLIKGAI